MTKDTKSLKTILKNTLWCLKFIFAAFPGFLILIVAIQIIASIFPFIRNRIFSSLIDSIVYHPNSNWMTYFLGFAILLILTGTMMFFQNQVGRILDIKLQNFLRTRFISKVSSLDYQHLEGKVTGNLISKVDEEFGWRIRQTVSDITNIFANLVSLMTVSFILLPHYPNLWLLIFLSQIPQYIIEKHWVQKNWQIHEQNSDKNKMMWDLNYQLRHKNYIAELRVNNAVQYLYSKYKDIFDFFTKSFIGLRLQQAPIETGLILFSSAINLLCLLTLITQTRSGFITIGLFTFYFQTISNTTDFFRSLVFSSVSITENSYHIGNFRQIMDLKNILHFGQKTIPQPHPPLIEFIDVSFKYPDSKHYVYRHLNLTIRPGEEIALVGQNGAGKSTLVKLICHFYEPTSGKILINGIDLNELSAIDWYSQLSYLAQEFNRYSNLTLRENVTLQDQSQVNDLKVQKALKKADADFTQKYNKKLDTFMSQRYGGEEPSWGQAQKIAIARIFYKDSPIIILDEPTASIDAVSEYKIFNRLYEEISHKTLIIVSHRFSTVRNAKRIIVIDKGKIIEEGSHEELIKKNGTYAHSFHLQAKGYN